MAIDGPRLELEAIPGLPAPATIHGAYRCGLIGLDQSRRVLYGDPANEVSDAAIRRPVRLAGDGLPPSWHQSSARLLLLAEPRPLINVELAGPPRVEEAVDDQGRSLIAPAPRFDYPDRYSKTTYLFGRVVNVPLDLPDPPGRSIRRLRGSVPVVTWVLRPEVLEVPLNEPPGRPLRGSGVNLKVIPGKSTPPSGTVVVELSPLEPDQPLDPALALFEAGPGRLFLDHDAQFEVTDGAGKRIEVNVATDFLGPLGIRQVTLTPQRGSARSVPARLRYRGLSWSRTAVPFDFQEVPLP